MPPERAALRSEVEELRRSVTDLNRVLERLVTEKVDAKVEEKVDGVVDAKVDAKLTEVDPIGRAEFTRRIRRSGQRVAIALVAVLALAALLVGLNRTTLQLAQRQAEEDLRRLVQVCRTTTPTISPGDLRWCEGRVPGFGAARERAADLAATAARNERRLRHLEAEVQRLQRRR